MTTVDLASLEDLLRSLLLTQQYQLAAQYTKRYQDIIIRVPAQTLSGQPSSPDIEGVLHAYVDLCAEELSLHESGQIPDPIWQNWKEGIIAGNRLPAVNVLWQHHFATGPYESLRKFLEKNGVL